MQDYTLERTGQAPLTFAGEMLARHDSRRTAGRDNNRWHVVVIYRTAAGAYVAEVVYRTCWQGEQDRYWAVAAAAGDVAAVLRELGAQSMLLPIGYPAGEAYADRQTRMLVDLRARYDEAVSRVLDDDPAFAERIE